MAEKKDGGENMSPHGVDLKRNKADLTSKRIFDGNPTDAELRDFKYDMLAEWLKKAHTIDEVEHICKQFASTTLPRFMREEFDIVLESFKFLHQSAQMNNGLPELGIIESFRVTPVRRRLRDIYYPAAAKSTVATPELREKAMRLAEEQRMQAEATAIRLGPNESTRITPPSVAAADTARTAIIAPQSGVSKAGPNDVTGKYPVVKSPKPWWKIW